MIGALILITLVNGFYEGYLSLKELKKKKLCKKKNKVEDDKAKTNEAEKEKTNEAEKE